MFIIALFSLATHDEEETTISPLPIVSLRSLSLSLSFAARQYIWPAWAAHVGLTAKPTETGYTHKRAGRVGKRHTPGRRVHRASSLTPAIFPRRGHVAYQAPHTHRV